MSRDTRSLLGVIGLACLACCIGPIIAMVGAVGVLTSAGVAVVGIGGAALALLVVPGYVHQRRRGRCSTTAEPVAVAPPVVRSPR